MRLSIVIATYRRPGLLRRVLDRLEGQRGVKGDEFEAIVVADHKEDDLAAVAASVGDRPYETRVLRGEAPGVSATRNRGWPEAKAPLVLFIGDDMLPAPDLVAQHLSWHERHPAEEVGVLGHVRWARELRAGAFMRWLEHGIQFDYPRIEGIEAGWGRFYAANASLKKGLLARSGGFDPDFRFGYEELELARRLADLGFRLLYNRAAVVEHLHPATIPDWERRMATVAAAERQMVAKHPDVEPYFFKIFSAAAAAPRSRGRGARLAALVPPGFPWLGPRVWAGADTYFRQRLAPAFLAAWEKADRDAPQLSEAEAGG